MREMSAIARHRSHCVRLLSVVVEGSDFIVLMRLLELPKILSLAFVSFLDEATLADLTKGAVSPKAVSPKAGRYLNQCRLSKEGEQPHDLNGADLPWLA